jgi:nitroreductase
MDLSEAMRSQHACRYYKPDPVPDEVFHAAIDDARFGPQGGNRQPVRFLIVRDPDKRAQLAEWYRIPWKQYIAAMREGQASVAASDGTEKSTAAGGMTKLEKAMADADAFADALQDHPTIIVACADISLTHPTDTELDRLSIVGGASVYPTVQNLCLALRARGVATTFTTLLVMFEPQVKELLGIPEHLATAAHVVAGYPANPFPRRLTRLPVEELAFVDSFDQPLTA